MKAKRVRNPHWPSAIYRCASAGVRLNYLHEYNESVCLLMEKCTEIISESHKAFLKIRISFNGNQLSCLCCGNHHDVYQSKCPKCFKNLAIERDEAITVKNYWESLAHKLEAEGVEE